MIEIPKPETPKSGLGMKITWRSVWQMLVGGLVGAVLSYALLRSGMKVAPRGAPPLLVVFVVVAGVVLSFGINLVLHEFGHALAARLSGGTVLRVVLGPWRWERVRSGFRFRKHRTIKGVGGFVQSILPADQRFRAAMSIMILGGPLANLLLAAIGWWLLANVDMHYVLRILALEITIFALMLGGLNLLPFTNAGFLTDGGHLRRLWTEPLAASRYQQIMRMARASIDGKRPRDIDPAELNAMMAQDLSPMELFFTEMTRASMLADRGDLVGARRINAGTLKRWDSLPDGFRQHVALSEAIASATLDRDPKRAREWLALAESGLMEDYHYAAAEILIAELENDPVSRELSIARLRRGLDESIYLGDVAVYREKLNAWERA